MSAQKIKVILDKQPTRAQRVEAEQTARAVKATAYMQRRAQSRKGSK